MRGNYVFPKELLLNYGFRPDKAGFLLEKDFGKGVFQAQIRVQDNILSFHLIDKTSGDPYPLVNLDQTGEFLTPLKEEKEMLLKDILSKCAIYRYASKQTNRIYTILEKEFGSSFVHIFEKYPEFAVLRNESKKWFALLVEIEGRKIHREEERIDLLNVRNDDIDPFMTLGVLPAYHMNKGTWVSLVLNDTLSDFFVLEKVRKSLELSRGKSQRTLSL